MDLETSREISRLQQVTIEDTYDRKQIRTYLRDQIGTEDPYFNKLHFEVETFCINHTVTSITPLELTTELMLTVLIIDRGPIQSVASNLAMNIDTDQVYLEKVCMCMTLLLAASGIVFDVERTQSDAYVVIPKFKLTGPLKDYIEQKKYLPPMVTVPKKWLSNKGGGYLTRNESCVLGHNNHHEGQQATDVLNILQDIALELDLEALSYEETSNKVLDTDEKVKQFEHMCRESLVVYEDILNRGNEFYFVWKYDKRGRVYSSGYHINIQGTQYKKSIISFKRKELIEG